MVLDMRPLDVRSSAKLEKQTLDSRHVLQKALAK